MKAYVVKRSPGEPVINPPRIALIPSSAMILGGKPLFLAGYSDSWSMTPTVAFRLSRLGKTIEPKFASRYIDAVAPVMITHPDSLLKIPGTEALAAAADGAMALDKWTALADSGEYTLVSGEFTATFTAESLKLDDIIATLSRYMMLQMGDIIIPAMPDISIPINIGDTFEFSLNDLSNLLTVKIK